MGTSDMLAAYSQDIKYRVMSRDTVKVHKALLSKKHKQLKTYLARRPDKSNACLPHTLLYSYFSLT